MREKPKRLAPTFQTFRELFLKSGNLCAFPGCDALMITEEGIFIGQLCHIEAAETGGERFNPAMTNEERRSAPNLMLMCYPHHQTTNDVERYPAAALKKMKAEHETRFSGSDRATRELLAKVNRASLVGAGVIAGAGLSEIAHQIKLVLDSLFGSPDSKENIPLRKELQQRLRYAPVGIVYCYSGDPVHRAIGDLYLEIFSDAGWRIERIPAPPRWEGIALPNFERSMLMMFVIQKKDQLSNARQAIDDFFRLCGFHIGGSKQEAVREQDEYQITFWIPVLVAGELPTA